MKQSRQARRDSRRAELEYQVRKSRDTDAMQARKQTEKLARILQGEPISLKHKSKLDPVDHDSINAYRLAEDRILASFR